MPAPHSVVSCFRSLLVSLIAALVVASIVSCATSPTIDLSDVEIIDIVNNPEGFAALDLTGDGSQPPQPFILKVPAGHGLPVHLSIDTPLASMASTCSTLNFHRDLFVYMSSSHFLVSPDATQWAPFDDLEQIKSLFGVGAGELSVGMSGSQEDGATLQIGISTRD